ncbi:hypothetical protein DEM34_15570 [Spiribacter halobius]|uniref:Uncharacterized protein n=2 Tax=Sediminicurvatus halobius TaxID=2182432 RepID=A0A2U2MXR4_9GAMM|nr:hypothetical protein DEM34_15570 [Spiribacter halobius]
MARLARPSCGGTVMRARRFKALMASLADITEAQPGELRQGLGEAHEQRQSILVIEEALPIGCHHCASERAVRNGTRLGIRRWLCPECGRSGTATTVCAHNAEPLFTDSTFGNHFSRASVNFHGSGVQRQ